MVRALMMLAFSVAVVSWGSFSIAEEKKDAKVKLDGTLVCTKCSLGETKACGHALLVTEKGKEVVYYLNDKGGKEPYHPKVCKADKPATVEGKLAEKNGKKTIDSPKVTIK